MTKNRHLWLKLWDMPKRQVSIKVTDEKTGTAKVYPVTLTECALLDWYATMSYRDEKPKKDDKIVYDVAPVEMTKDEIAKAVGLSRARLTQAQRCLAAMNLIVPVSKGHRSYPYYALSPHMGIVRSSAEIHKRMLYRFPEPIFGDSVLVDDVYRHPDYKWGPPCEGVDDGDSLGDALD
ncbi:hypothetical protein C0216_08630 [Streptomyces globosus]|uniref:Uncharacterized protein n=1 Tax=Streptomyces globosus TaxID=68209 RepID=A0A344TXZ7_9ACTN|nr:hypothetical protein C0216_08630 [Streptomyces globosus]